jgi:Bacterial RNA polymerase, alpha chain C terminal domain
LLENFSETRCTNTNKRGQNVHRPTVSGRSSHRQQRSGQYATTPTPAPTRRQVHPPTPAPVDASLPVDFLDLTVRSRNALRRDGVHTIGDLTVRTTTQLAGLRQFGPGCIDDVALARHRLRLATPPADEPPPGDTVSGPTTPTLSAMSAPQHHPGSALTVAPPRTYTMNGSGRGDQRPFYRRAPDGLIEV